MKTLGIIITVLLITLVLLTANKYLHGIDIQLTQNPFMNGLVKYQIVALFIALLGLVFTLKITPESKSLLHFGNLGTKATKELWLGINGKSTWSVNGLQLIFFISLATGIFMFLAVRSSNIAAHFSWKLFPFIFLISLTNSFSEEVIYRFMINGNLMNELSKFKVLIISAILFGLPHYFGNPSGLIGVVMAGVLGYILSKMTYETQGIGLAWLIHFIQDIIIFTGVVMINQLK